MIDTTKMDMTSLYDNAREIVNMYRQELERQKVNASGDLSRSADFDFDFDENDIALYFIYNSYGYYVDEGRRPTGGGGGQSWGYPKNVDDISRWIQNKMGRGQFVPRNNQTIPRTDKEIKRVAYAIVQKLHKVGYYGQNHYGLHILEQVVRKADQIGLINKMVNAVVQGYNNEVALDVEKL